MKLIKNDEGTCMITCIERDEIMNLADALESCLTQLYAKPNFFDQRDVKMIADFTDFLWLGYEGKNIESEVNEG